jgi:hypothetical protein
MSSCCEEIYYYFQQLDGEDIEGQDTPLNTTPVRPYDGFVTYPTIYSPPKYQTINDLRQLINLLNSSTQLTLEEKKYIGYFFTQYKDSDVAMVANYLRTYLLKKGFKPVHH